MGQKFRQGTVWMVSLCPIISGSSAGKTLTAGSRIAGDWPDIYLYLSLFLPLSISPLLTCYLLSSTQLAWAALQYGRLWVIGLLTW